MNVSHAWLQDFFDTALSASQIRDILTAHTATVDELVPLRQDLAPIVVARVVTAERHPEADKLWVTKVDAGGPEPLEVVCGAANVTAGRLYPFAPVGATIPAGLKIERRKIRGVVSNGMLCSARELALGENHEGIMELDLDATPGTPLLAAMPAGDTRIVVDVGANRADLQSHLGIAREVGAVIGREPRLPVIEGLGPPAPRATPAGSRGRTADVTVSVREDTRTRRYMGAVVRGVKVGPSPDWLTRRLAAVGVRSINTVVDATNYVLHELGQPVHAFDLAKLGRSVEVRLSHPDEKIVTLDGAARALPPDTVVIAGGDVAHAVAGIMGGRDSEVTEHTTDLFIEVASFDPARIRGARRRLGTSTDASYRFERGVDPHAVPEAMDRVVRLILSLAGGSPAGAPVDLYEGLPERREIGLRFARVAQVLGHALAPSDVQRYLQGAGFGVLSADAAALRVRVPSWRSDVTEEVDLVEEVARFHGYDAFPVEIRAFRPTTTSDDPLWTVAERVRSAMVSQGLLEIRPMPFVQGHEDTHVRVSNPVAENESFLRASLMETLARRVEFNLAQRSGDVRLFEVGSAFRRAAGQPEEELRVGAVILGRRRPVHFTEPQPPAYDIWDARALAEVAAMAIRPGAGITMVPGGSSLWEVHADGEHLGSVHRLELDAPVWASQGFGIELRIGIVDAAPPSARGSHAYSEPGADDAVRARVKYRPLPVVPAAEFDLALVVPAGTPAAEVERVIRESAGDLLERLELFDLYTGPGIVSGYRSLAWRLTLRHPERTLRDKEIEGRRSRILGALQQELNVRQRST